MNTIQLDEDCDDKAIATACANEGKVTAYRFPSRLKGTLDPDVLAHFITKGNPILTLDKGFASDHADQFPNTHPGILILAFDDNVIRTMTTKAAQRMLTALKAEIPGWSDLNLDNSIVLVRNSSVEISHCESHELKLDGYLDRTVIGWQAELAARLQRNISPRLTS